MSRSPARPASCGTTRRILVLRDPLSLSIYIYIYIYMFVSLSLSLSLLLYLPLSLTLPPFLSYSPHECLFHRPAALTLSMSVNIDIRGDGGSPTMSTCRTSVYFADTRITRYHIRAVVTKTLVRSAPAACSWLIGSWFWPSSPTGVCEKTLLQKRQHAGKTVFKALNRGNMHSSRKEEIYVRDICTPPEIWTRYMYSSRKEHMHGG